MLDIQFLGNCPICNTRFNSQRAVILSKKEGLMTVYIDCENCKSSVMVAVFAPAKGIVTIVGMLTDISRDDLSTLNRKKDPLTYDDVLETHSYLEKNI